MKCKSITNKRIFIRFIGLYIITILFFAFIYTTTANQFYYATSKYENILREELNIIENEITKSINENFIKYYKSKSIYIDKNEEWVFSIDDLEIKKVDLNSDELNLEILVYLRKISDIESKYVTNFYFKLHNEEVFTNGKAIYRLGEISFKDDSTNMVGLKNINFSKIFYLKNDNISTKTIGLKLSDKLEKKINEIIKSVDGLPSRDEDRNFILNFKWNFPRMLYLSMVTITTLGYGDIVPLTNTVRILIGIESTLGIIIMGWFVNKMMNIK